MLELMPEEARSYWRAMVFVTVPIGAESVAVTTKKLARNSRVSDRKHLNMGLIPRKRGSSMM